MLRSVEEFLQSPFVDCEWSVRRSSVKGVYESLRENRQVRPGDSVASPKFSVWWADPFPFELSGRKYLLCEKWKRTSWKASIAVFHIAEDGDIEYLGVAISAPYHLSYPYIVRRGSEIFCVPEASRGGAVEIYRCEAPLEWKRCCTILDEPVIDPTIFKNNGSWWLAGLVRASPQKSGLWLWWSDNLFGPWKPHNGNPVATDPRTIRPAGTVVQADDELYRPSQDCRNEYGQKIIWNRIEQLDRRRYREVPTGSIEPWSDSEGWSRVHTIGVSPEQAFLDFGRDRVSLARAVGLTRYKLRSAVDRVL